MSAQLSRRILRIAGIALAASALPLALSACANTNPVPVNSSSASASTEPSPSASASASTDPNAIVPVALSKTCDDILSADALYAIKGGTNFAANPKYKPAAGSTAAKIAGMKGVTCGYINQTSGEQFSIAVAEVTPESAAPLKRQIANDFGNSGLVADYSPTPAIQGYFKVSNGIGEAQIGTSIYWVSIASATFEAPTDVLELVHDVETSLGR